jgi:hypothetical protein
MATFSKQLLSGSANGRMIKVVATATLGTTIHTTGISATIFDEVWLWAVNSDTTDRKLTIEFGGVGSPDDLIEVTIPAESGLVAVVPGLALNGTGAASKVVTAFCASANVVMIAGFVNRVTT